MDFLLDAEQSLVYLGLNNKEITDLIEGNILHPEDHPMINIETHFDPEMVLKTIAYSAPNYVGEILIGEQKLKELKELKPIPEGDVFGIQDNSLRFEYNSGILKLYHI